MTADKSGVGMLRHTSTRRHDRAKKDCGEHGQGLVEFALLLPVFLLLLLGMIQFGLVFHTYLTLEDGAHEGVRAATIDNGTQTLSQVTQAVIDAMPTLNSSSVTVTMNPSTTPRVNGTAVTVTVGYNLPIIIPIISGIMGSNMSLSSSDVMSVGS